MPICVAEIIAALRRCGWPAEPGPAGTVLLSAGPGGHLTLFLGRPGTRPPGRSLSLRLATGAASEHACQLVAAVVGEAVWNRKWQGVEQLDATIYPEPAYVISNGKNKHEELWTPPRRGTVLSYHGQHGYGFLQDDETKIVYFFHRMDVADRDLLTCDARGIGVEFEARLRPAPPRGRKPLARHIRIVKE